jgi:hypothetical protein
MISCRKSIQSREGASYRLIALSCVSLFALAPHIAVGDNISFQSDSTLFVSTETTVNANGVHSVDDNILC